MGGELFVAKSLSINQVRIQTSVQLKGKLILLDCVFCQQQHAKNKQTKNLRKKPPWETILRFSGKKKKLKSCFGFILRVILNFVKMFSVSNQLLIIYESSINFAAYFPKIFHLVLSGFGWRVNYHNLLHLLWEGRCILIFVWAKYN